MSVILTGSSFPKSSLNCDLNYDCCACMPKPIQLPEVVQVLTTEYNCVQRASENQCNRNCGNCDLVLDSQKILEAYEIAIEIIQERIDYYSSWIDVKDIVKPDEVKEDI